MSRDWRIVRIAAIVIALAVIGALVVARFEGFYAALCVAWNAVLPLVVGAIFAYLLNLVMKQWERIWFPRSENRFVKGSRRIVCIILAILSVALVLTAVISMVVGEFRSVASAVASGLVGAGQALSDIATQIPGLDEVLASGSGLWEGAASSALESIGGASQALKLVGNAGGEVARMVAAVVIGLIFAVYLLADKERVCAGAHRLVNLLPDEAMRANVLHVVATANECFSRFVLGQCIEATILGVLCALGCTIFGFPYALSIGLVVGISSLVPFLGAFIGGAVGAIMIFSQDAVQAVQFVVFLLVLQQIEGHLIYPNVVGQSVGLPSIWVFVAVVSGATLFGLPGVLLGVPIVSTLRTLVMEYLAARDDGDSGRDGGEDSDASGGSGGMNDAGSVEGEAPDAVSGACSDSVAEASAGAAGCASSAVGSGARAQA